MARSKRKGTIEVGGVALEINKTSLPDLWSKTQSGALSPIVAIGVADIHLQETAPIARSKEKDWYEVQRRALVELNYVKNKLDGVPILIAGDIFNKWNPRPELINFAIENMPSGCYAVPGNHDLPYHDYKLKEKSAYWTLVKANAIVDVPPSQQIHVGCGTDAVDIMVHGFPHGFEIEKMERDGRVRFLNIALVHSYIWTDTKGFPGAPVDQTSGSYHNKLREHGYSVGIFGDNHKGFSKRYPSLVNIFNCGTFIARNIDERNYKPQIGLIHADGQVTPYYMDTSLDKWASLDEIDEASNKEVIGQEVIDELMSLVTKVGDFNFAIERYMKAKVTNRSVKQIIREALEEAE